MSKKNKDRYGVVYSTNPDFRYQAPTPVEVPTLPPGLQKLRVMVDRKQRGGKEVTLIIGFIGLTQDIEDLGKLLKNKCGSGGSVKDAEILVQGNHRDKIVKILIDLGYAGTKAAGG